MLRWLLVLDPDERQLQIAKKCFLMNLNINNFRVNVIESSMEKIVNIVGEHVKTGFYGLE